MYFKQSDIQEAKEHVVDRVTELNVLIGANDMARFNKVVDTIFAQKTYYEGEEIDPRHTMAIKSTINMIISNLSDYLVKNPQEVQDASKLTNPVDYFSTAVDALFLTAMERLGCPNMPILHFDQDIKETLEQSAIEVHRSFVSYDFSKDIALGQQRGKDADEVSKNFDVLIKGINGGEKAESVGKMIAEYQALKERQRDQSAFWRILHRTEDQARNDLLEKMGQAIKNQFPDQIGDIDLDTLDPASISRQFAEECIRGEVETAGPNRLDSACAKKIFGCAPAIEHIDDQYDLFAQHPQKVSMGKDANFVQDIIGNDNAKSQPLIQGDSLEKHNVIGIN